MMLHHSWLIVHSWCLIVVVSSHDHDIFMLLYAHAFASWIFMKNICIFCLSVMHVHIIHRGMFIWSWCMFLSANWVCVHYYLFIYMFICCISYCHTLLLLHSWAVKCVHILSATFYTCCCPEMVAVVNSFAGWLYFTAVQVLERCCSCCCCFIFIVFFCFRASFRLLART